MELSSFNDEDAACNVLRFDCEPLSISDPGFTEHATQIYEDLLLPVNTLSSNASQSGQAYFRIHCSSSRL